MENHQNHKPEPEPNIEKNHQRQHQHHNQAWGTWEELLLACAVNRHGFKDWDTVAMEVQSRTTRLLATARHCEQKFHDLNRRFADQCNDDVPPPCQNGAAAGDNSDHVPWLDELRKLRVAELHREVQRRDVSILSLQLEVKRLEEEKAKENDGKDDEKPDLAVSGEARPENDKTGGEVEEAGPANSEPERTANADKMLPTTGDESDRENQSVNESNSTGSRFEKTGEGDTQLGTGTGPVPVQTGSQEPDPVARKGKPVGEESNNGSYDALAKVPTCESVPPSEERKVEEDDESSELHDSVAHSGEGGTRESSEVQSSASLTRKRKTRPRKEVSGGDGRAPAENDEVAMVKSEPLLGVLELIKGHEHNSLFDRRLESQESDRYKDIVKQPLDLETIQLRLQKGHYSSCTSAFFRDLLLLFTNATVFFPHDSTESQAAQLLRCLVTAEMKNHGQAQSDPIPRKNDSLSPKAPLAKPDSLFSKNKASGPILVCRKRSSISAKPSSATFSQKGDQPIFNDKKERSSSDAKPPLKPSTSDTDEEELPKAKEKPVTGARSLRRSNKNLNNKKLSSNSNPKAGSSGNKPSETLKPDKSKAEGGSDKKRNAAADFLKRIKRNTSVEASKVGSGGGGGGGSSSSSKGGGGGIGVKEQKKMVTNGKGDKGKERGSRHNGGGSASSDKRNKNIENNSQSKRGVGRPPKKAAETNAGSAKRGRESSASAGKDKRPKKRSKK
ncbi:Bromodomain-containing protein 8 [Spatholobus suberectus]|nr:Bromodomain-containing protein 8 [Spatholobus suberectus]